MSDNDRKRLKEIQTFPALVKYLRDDLGWPVNQDSFDDLDEITFDWEADELGIDPEQAAKIEYIKQLRPIENGQPQGVFFVKFNNKSLPVVALRRLLGKLVVKKRATAAAAERPLWAMRDLVFISSYGENDERQLSFAYFQEPEHKSELPTLKVLGWDDRDTPLHLDRVHDQLTTHLMWPDSATALPTWRKDWAQAFELRHGQVVSTAMELAEQLAALARGIRERANQLLKLETQTGPLRTLMEGFKRALIHDLTEDQFADMYAQTIAYGLLSARITHPDPVKAETLPDLIPVTNPFLKELMETFVLAGGRHRGRKRGLHLDFDELGINAVVELLRRANMDAILRNFGADDRKDDPVTYFYEDFLNAYDAHERKRRGVYYTPKPVVSYIVRSVHELLQTELGIDDGLASTITWAEMAKRDNTLKIPPGVPSNNHFVKILDPATGTATFLVTVIEVVFETLTARWNSEGLSDAKQSEAWNSYVPAHLLPRLFGYELMMAPYAIAHLKIGLKLFETGYRFESGERARIYLTNTLETATDASYSQIDALSDALAHEAHAVNEVKRSQRYTVVIGNPPYSAISSNLTPILRRIVDPYRAVNGEAIQERSMLQFEKNIQDDYVKFFAFAQAAIAQSARGICSLISNHSYLDGPTLRGLRWNLISDFDKCWFLDLHGNANKSEEPPEDLRDENVFDIRQGVAICLLLRSTELLEAHSVSVCDLWGGRDQKYARLAASNATQMDWTDANPTPPYYYLVKPDSPELDDEWNAWPAVSEVFAKRSTGTETGFDDLLVAFSRRELEAQITRFADSASSRQAVAAEFDISEGHAAEVFSRRKELRNFSRADLQRFQLRAYDWRWGLMRKDFLKTNSFNVMRDLGGNRPGLVTTRQTKEAFGAFAVNSYAGHKLTSSYDRSYVLPLFTGNSEGLLRDEVSCIDRKFMGEILLIIGDKNSMRQDDRELSLRIFEYIIGIFNSTGYVGRFETRLGRDWPRIPIPGAPGIFHEIAKWGAELVALQLMTSPKLNDFITTYTGATHPEVGRVVWSDDTVWLDAEATHKNQSAKPGTTGFVGVSEAVWTFHIGGYQVCEKWLKDRKGRKLSNDDIGHYQKVVVAIAETIRMMKEIDDVIEKYGGWPGAFKLGTHRTT